MSLVVGSTFGKVRDFLESFVDRFIFRERHAQRTALERVAANLLDADDAASVYSVLLHEVPSMGSSAIGFIVGLYTSVTKNPGGRFAMVGATPRVKEVFALTHLDTVIPSSDTLESALAAFAS